MSRGTQPMALAPWPTPGTTKCRLLGSVLAASSAQAGGVTGSSSPESSSTGVSLRTGAAKLGGRVAPGPHRAALRETSGWSVCEESPARRLDALLRRDAGEVLGADD